MELDPWGGETTHASNQNQAFQPRKFTSYIRDAIGSDDAMHRRYDRGFTRFQQPDPYNGSYDLTNPQSFNRYAYVNNDPVNFIDPFGLDPGGSLGSGLANLFNGGGLGSGLAGLVNMGPPPSIVTVPIDGDQTDIERRRDLEDLVNPVLSEAKTLLTKECTEFLNEILAELSKFREPYSRNFIKNIKAAQGAIHKVLLSDEVRKERSGGTISIIGDPSLDITVDARSFGSSDLNAGYTIIREVAHASAGSGRWYNHLELATAAYKVAASRGLLKKLQIVRFFVESCGSPVRSVYAALLCCTNPFCEA